MTFLIDVWEEEDTSIADISGAYAHAEFLNGKTTILKLKAIWGLCVLYKYRGIDMKEQRKQ